METSQYSSTIIIMSSLSTIYSANDGSTSAADNPVVMCNLRSTIPLRLDRKPPCRPIFVSLQDTLMELEKMSPAASTSPATGTAPMVPLPPPPPPPKKASNLDLPQGLQGSTQSHVNVKSVICGCDCMRGRREHMHTPFNGVPPLLAVIQTQQTQKL